MTCSPGNHNSCLSHHIIQHSNHRAAAFFGDGYRTLETVPGTWRSYQPPLNYKLQSSARKKIDILPQQAETPVENFRICSRISSIKESAPSDFMLATGAIYKIDHASRRVSARAAKLQANS